MPLYNFTISDSSPFIIFNGSWNDTSSNVTADARLHTTNDSSATASIAFYGSAIYVFGSADSTDDDHNGHPHGGGRHKRRSKHHGRPHSFASKADYQVTLDGVVQGEDADGATSTLDSLLFSADNLTNTQHQLMLANSPQDDSSTSLNVDFMVITTGDGNPQTQPASQLWDDSNSNITYSGEWPTSPNGFEQFYFQETMHRTMVQGASATITFRGNTIELYGATSTNHGPYSVSIDGAPARVMNGTAPEFRPGQLLYYASGLTNTSHILKLTNQSPSGEFLDLDKVVVTTWPPNPVSADTANMNSGSSSVKNQAAVIVGSVLAAVISIAFISLAFALWLRRKKRPPPPPPPQRNSWASGKTEEGAIDPFPPPTWGRPVLTVQTKMGPTVPENVYAAPSIRHDWPDWQDPYCSQHPVMPSRHSADGHLTYGGSSTQGTSQVAVNSLDSKRFGIDPAPLPTGQTLPEPPPNYSEAAADLPHGEEAVRHEESPIGAAL